MIEQYKLYAVMTNGSRYILKIDEYYLKVLLSFTYGELDQEAIQLMNTLMTVELEFLLKLTNGECEYLLLKSKDSKIVRRIETDIYSKV